MTTQDKPLQIIVASLFAGAIISIIVGSLIYIFTPFACQDDHVSMAFGRTSNFSLNDIPAGCVVYTGLPFTIKGFSNPTNSVSMGFAFVLEFYKVDSSSYLIMIWLVEFLNWIFWSAMLALIIVWDKHRWVRHNKIQ